MVLGITATVDGCSRQPHWGSVVAIVRNKAVMLNRLIVRTALWTPALQTLCLYTSGKYIDLYLERSRRPVHRYICTMPDVGALPYLSIRVIDPVFLAACPRPAATEHRDYNWGILLWRRI